MAPAEITGIRSRPVDQRGPWIATSSGALHSVLTPSVQDLRISDVAAGLARECRYNSQIRIDRPFLSCVEHNLAMLQVAHKEDVLQSAQDAFAVLMTGAVKAYLRDMAKPVTKALPDYRRLREIHEKNIEAAFLCAPRPQLSEWIRTTSERIRLDERQCLLLDPAKSEGLLEDQEMIGRNVKPVFVEFQFLSPHESMRAFLEKVVELSVLAEKMQDAEDPSFRLMMRGIAVDAKGALEEIPANGDRYNMGPDILETFEDEWLDQVAGKTTRLGFDEWVSQRPEWEKAAGMTFTVDVVKNGSAQRFYLVSPDDAEEPLVDVMENNFREMTGIEGGSVFFCRTSRFDLYEMGQDGFSIAYAQEPVVMKVYDTGRLEVVDITNAPDEPFA